MCVWGGGGGKKERAIHGVCVCYCSKFVHCFIIMYSF